MLNYKIISKKPILNRDNEKFIDLFVNTYKNNNSIKGTLIGVNEHYVARPDLISLAVYGTDDYADLICKVNGISNPFDLNENMILFIPSPDAIYELTINSQKASDLIKDDDDIKNKNNKDFRKRLSEKRSPNELTIGDSNYIIDKSLGLVFY